MAADASKGNLLTLSGNEIDAFLLSRHRSAESLLAAYQLSGDDAYLIEALQKFPQDPAVLLASLRLSGDPAENLKTLEALKLADPGNGLGHCLAARALFDLGRTDEALAELLRMSGKPLDDYMILSCQAVEEAYIAAGFSSLDAKITSLYSATKPSLMKMGSPLVKNLDAMRTAYEASGNQEGVDSIRRIQAEIGARLRSAGSLVDELVGILHEKAALRGLDSPDAADRLNEVEQRKTALTQASWKIPKLMENPAVPESDWVSYFDRVKLFGEKAANNWILERYPE
ncbi:MAG: hypothetical protein EOP87_06435 [Verrucomicrobiaceae bacterium]|nr:MAG: hypothetical protein EOP87_06435 [Verrucomicrobiaceae bacterium]